MEIKHIKTVDLPWNEPAGPWAGRFPGWTWKDLHRTDGVEVSLWKLEPGRADEPHMHQDGDEHVYIIAGEVESNGRRFSAGDYVFRPAGVLHSSSTTVGAEMLLVFVKRATGQRA